MAQHWENIYSTKDLTKVSWFEKEATFSVDLIQKEIAATESLAARDKSLRLIDMGSGDSLLSCQLLASGFTSLTAADISATAIRCAKSRCTEEDSDTRINWIVADVTKDLLPAASFDVWHDRAVFHFMTTEEAQAAYIRNCAGSISDQGLVIVGTFSRTGPTHCSNLQIVQHDEESLRKQFSEDWGFDFVRSFDYVHVTPSGNRQAFIFAVFRCKKQQPISNHLR